MTRTIALIAALCLLAAPSFAAENETAKEPAATPPAAAAKPNTPPPSSKGMTPEQMFDAMFKNMDKDSDGKVSKDEFLAAPIKTFEMRDENKDGFLSKQEIMPKAPPGAKKQ